MRSILAGLLLSSAVIAFPVPDEGIGPDDATCTLQYKTNAGTYIIEIGEPIAGEAGCDPVKHTIEKDYGVDTDLWKCEDNGHGMTYIEFNVRENTDKVNAAMREAYPMIDWGTDEAPKCNPYKTAYHDCLIIFSCKSS